MKEKLELGMAVFCMGILIGITIGITQGVMMEKGTGERALALPLPEVNTTWTTGHNCEAIANETSAWLNESGILNRVVVVGVKDSNNTHAIVLAEFIYSNGRNMTWAGFNESYFFMKQEARADECKAWRCVAT